MGICAAYCFPQQWRLEWTILIIVLSEWDKSGRSWILIKNTKVPYEAVGNNGGFRFEKIKVNTEGEERSVSVRGDTMPLNLSRN